MVRTPVAVERGFAAEPIVTIRFHAAILCFREGPVGHEFRSEGPEKWRTAPKPPDGGFCYVSNLQLPARCGGPDSGSKNQSSTGFVKGTRTGHDGAGYRLDGLRVKDPDWA